MIEPSTHATIDHLERAKALKQQLLDFVMDSEDDLATALESFSAAKLSRSHHTDLHRRMFVVDRFLVEGRVGSATAIDCFIEAHPDLTAIDQQLLRGWRQSFVGLFAVQQCLPSGMVIMNWTTAKHYPIQLTASEQVMAAKLKPGEIILVQIAPLDILADRPLTDWMVMGSWVMMGKLGKPKLAVAIGNFKENYKEHLYSDAPELLAEAWRSVERYHQNFIDFFGNEEVTLPGYQLNKKLTEFQQALLDRQMEAAGIDRSKSIQEMAIESGVSPEEIADAAAALGADTKVVSQMMNTGQPPKMMAPAVELPAHLKQAEAVTVLTHPRWGQAFLPHYSQLIAHLEAAELPEADVITPIIQKHLAPDVPAFVWYRLAERYPERLQALLRIGLNQPDFQLQSQLDQLLQDSGRSLETELPEIASVPLHLHNLFQEAVLEVSKDKSKKKTKPKATGGFQR
jgi:hypothetical protein